jgi:xanthine dehydrogenase accessory factor
VTVIDPIAQADAFPGAERVHTSADIRGLDPNASPYVVVASQGIWDEEAVGLALTRDASYVGLVASPTRAGVVREWLREETTIGDERIAALRAPAGLDIGAESAEEIALSILAELVQVRRGRADFVASPGPATVAGVIPEGISFEPVVDDIVLVDPVCGMTVDRAHARHLADHDGVIYAFCSIGCRTRFIKEPVTYLSASEPSPMHD